jgi:hypothetical protein
METERRGATRTALQELFVDFGDDADIALGAEDICALVEVLCFVSALGRLNMIISSTSRSTAGQEQGTLLKHDLELLQVLQSPIESDVVLSVHVCLGWTQYDDVV